MPRVPYGFVVDARDDNFFAVSFGFRDDTTERVDSKGGKTVTTYTRVVSKDGKTMTVTVKGTDAKGQAVSNVVVFEKK